MMISGGHKTRPYDFGGGASSIFKVAIKRGQTKLAWSLPSVSNFGRRPISIFNLEST